MRQPVRPLGELDRLHSRLVEQNGSLEHIHGRRVETGTQIYVAPPVLTLSLDHCSGRFAGQAGRVEQVVILENADGSGPLQRCQRGLYRASERIVERQESGRLTGPKHKV